MIIVMFFNDTSSSFISDFNSYFCPMGIIYLMLIVSLVMALIFLFAFFWAAKSGQYDDDYTPSVRMLFDDEKIKNTNTKSNGTTEV